MILKCVTETIPVCHRLDIPTFSFIKPCRINGFCLCIYYIESSIYIIIHNMSYVIICIII